MVLLYKRRTGPPGRELRALRGTRGTRGTLRGTNPLCVRRWLTGLLHCVGILKASGLGGNETELRFDGEYTQGGGYVLCT